MLKCINLKNDDDGLKDWCLMLWKSRRLSHTMCGSPICDVFLKKCKWSTDVDIWKCYMEEIHEVGFEHKLNISSNVPYYQDPAIGTSIKLVKEDSTKLIKRVWTLNLYTVISVIPSCLTNYISKLSDWVQCRHSHIYNTKSKLWIKSWFNSWTL